MFNEVPFPGTFYILRAWQCEEVVSAGPVATVRRNTCVAAVLHRYLRSVCTPHLETLHPSHHRKSEQVLGFPHDPETARGNL
jgi:hypothetical protein